MVKFINKTPYFVRLTVTPDNPECSITKCTTPTINGFGGCSFAGMIDCSPVKDPQTEILSPRGETLIYNTGRNYRVSVEYCVTEKVTKKKGFWPFLKDVEVDGETYWKVANSQKSYNHKIKEIPFTFIDPNPKYMLLRSDRKRRSSSSWIACCSIPPPEESHDFCIENDITDHPTPSLPNKT